MEIIDTKLKIQTENISLHTVKRRILEACFKKGEDSAAMLNLKETFRESIKSQYEPNKKALWIYKLDCLNSRGQLSILRQWKF